MKANRTAAGLALVASGLAFNAAEHAPARTPVVEEANPETTGIFDAPVVQQLSLESRGWPFYFDVHAKGDYRLKPEQMATSLESIFQLNAVMNAQRRYVPGLDMFKPYMERINEVYTGIQSGEVSKVSIDIYLPPDGDSCIAPGRRNYSVPDKPFSSLTGGACDGSYAFYRRTLPRLLGRGRGEDRGTIVLASNTFQDKLERFHAFPSVRFRLNAEQSIVSEFDHEMVHALIGMGEHESDDMHEGLEELYVDTLTAMLLQSRGIEPIEP